MRAKFEVLNCQQMSDATGAVTAVKVKMLPVSGNYDKEGYSEDNEFSKWTPSGMIELDITNPNLFNRFERGQKYYADFTEVEEPVSQG
jgi:hypothetical protein